MLATQHTRMSRGRRRTARCGAGVPSASWTGTGSLQTSQNAMPPPVRLRIALARPRSFGRRPGLFIVWTDPAGAVAPAAQLQEVSALLAVVSELGNLHWEACVMCRTGAHHLVRGRKPAPPPCLAGRSR